MAECRGSHPIPISPTSPVPPPIHLITLVANEKGEKPCQSLVSALILKCLSHDEKLEKHEKQCQVIDGFLDVLDEPHRLDKSNEFVSQFINQPSLHRFPFVLR